MDSKDNKKFEIEAKELFDIFFHHASYPCLYIDILGNVLQANPAACRFFGFEISELINRNFNEFIPSHKKSELNKILENVRSTNNENAILSISTKQFEVPVKVNLNHLFNVNNSLSGIIVILEEIFTQKPISLNSLQGESLKNNEKIVNTILENTKDVIYIFNYQTLKIEFISPSIYDLSGYSPEEIINMGEEALEKIIHSDFYQIYLTHFKNLKNESLTQSHYNIIEYKIRPKAGISKWVSDNQKLIWDDNGIITSIIGNIRDITDFKLVEDAMKRSRDRLYKAIEATNDGMWDWRVDTNKIYFDERFYTMAGYLPHEYPPTLSEWLNHIHPDDLQTFKTALQKHLDGELDQLLVEYRFKTKDGNWIWILNRGKTFEKNDRGNSIRMVGIHTDISLRQQIKEELQKRNEELEAIHDQLQTSEEKFRQLAENTQDAFWLADSQSVLYVNPSFEKIWEISAFTIYNEPNAVEIKILPEDQPNFRSLLDINIDKDQPLIERFRIIKKDGGTRWIWSRRFPVLNDQNKIYRIAGIATDITDQYAIEEALVAAKEKALESDRLKSAFLANISHEIRTPMNGILGFTGLLKDENLPYDTRMQFINFISKSGEQLLHIIDDIIDISKIEANQIPLKNSDFYVKDIILELYEHFDNLRRQIGKSNISLITSIDSEFDNIKLFSDQIRVKQIFSNLLSNAFKFTSTGILNLVFK